MSKKIVTMEQLLESARQSEALSVQVAQAAQTALNGKQNKLTGAEGQVVGFDAEGNPVPQAAPKTGLTQEQGDARYLKLSGGTLTGNLTFSGKEVGFIFYDRALVYDRVAGTLACILADQIDYASPDYAPIVCADPTSEFHASTKNYVDNTTKPTAWKPFYAGATAPSDKTQFWIDTTATTGGLKYWDGPSAKWVTVPVATT